MVRDEERVGVPWALFRKKRRVRKARCEKQKPIIEKGKNRSGFLCALIFAQWMKKTALSPGELVFNFKENDLVAKESPTTPKRA